MSAFFIAQMDYVFFVYGLSCLLLAVTVYSLYRSKSVYPFWKWIALFAFLLGMAEWMDMIALNFWNDTPFRLFRWLFLTVSFLCLVEIVRQEAVKKWGRICGPWIYVPLVLAVVWPGWMMDGWAGINALARYVFGVMGGLCAARVIYLVGRKTQPQNRSLSLFAIVLGGFALTQFFVAPASLFPASLVNRETFLNGVGIPIQVFRMFLAVALAFLAWQCYLLQRKDHVVRLKSSFYVRMGWVFPSFLLFFILMGWGAAELLGERRMQEKKDVLFSLAQYSAGALDASKVMALTGTLSDLGTENYEDLFHDALGVYLRYPDSASVYMFGRRDGKHIFLYDSMNPKARDTGIPAAEPGEVYPLDHDVLEKMFRNGGTRVIGPEADKWGNFMSGFAAIRRPDTGEVIAVLGVDYNVDEWMADVARYRLGVIIVTILFITLYIIFSFVYLREKEVQQDLKGREKKLLELSGLLEEERGNLETIFNSTQVGLMLVDAGFKVRRVNAVLSRLIGRDPQAFLGNRPGQGFACVHLDKKLLTCGNSEFCPDCPVAGMISRVLDSGVEVMDSEFRYEYQSVFGETRTLWFAANASPLFMAGQRHVLLSLADITQRKAADQELQEYRLRLENLVRSRTEALNQTNQKLMREVVQRQEAHRELQEAKNKAEEASKLKSQFLFNVSHEIRTPLNGIIGFAELITRCEDMARARMMARTVLNESDILLTLVNDILDQAKIEAGKMTLENRVVDIRDLFSGMIKTMSMAANKKGLMVALESSGDVPRFVYTDRLRLCQIIWNFFNNSVKFTTEGSVTLRAELLDRRLDMARVKFSIRDTGVGIADDKKHLIFERFAQIDGTATRVHGGAGLGTSIAKGLVELMGGEAGFESKLGEGSTFWFILPLKVCDAADVPQEKPQEHAGAIPSAGIKGPILVVEDYPVNQDVVRMHMGNGGYEGDFVADGAMALEACKLKEYKLILMDIQMPGMDGYETVRHIRALGGWAEHVPVLGVTANADEDTRRQCLEVGMVDVMTKPIRGQIFLALLSDILGGKVFRSPTFNRGAVSDAQQDVPVMDHEAAVREFAGNQALLDSISKKFLAQVKKQIDTIARAIQARDGAVVGAEAHKIKGAAANLTAMRVSLSAKALEEKGKSGNLDGVDKLFAALKDELAVLEVFVRNGYKRSV